MKRSDHRSLKDNLIRNVALVGGTHGNELTGVTSVRRRNLPAVRDGAGLPAPRAPETFTLTAMLGNPEAVRANRRYIDFDLNRCFSTRDLENPHIPGYERQRAQVLNRILGPKGAPDPAYQFTIDLHTTTANLGSTVIIREDDALARIVAAAVVTALPEVRIMSFFAEDSGENPAEAGPVGGGPGSANRPGDYPYLAEITPHGIEIEVGPVPQGVVRSDVLIQTERIINAIVATLDAWNRDTDIAVPEEITAFRYTGDSDFPREDDGTLAGMIHPDRQDRDFEALRPGDPLYLRFDGGVVTYEGPPGMVPLFVNEAAYYEKRAALTLAVARPLSVIP